MAIDWTKIYKKYKGLWVALKQDEKTVVASGKTVREVMEKAKKRVITTRFWRACQRSWLPTLASGYEIQIQKIRPGNFEVGHSCWNIIRRVFCLLWSTNWLWRGLLHIWRSNRIIIRHRYNFRWKTGCVWNNWSSWTSLYLSNYHSGWRLAAQNKSGISAGYCQDGIWSARTSRILWFVCRQVWL